MLRKSWPDASDKGASNNLKQKPKINVVMKRPQKRIYHGFYFIKPLIANMVLASQPFMEQTLYDLGFINYVRYRMNLRPKYSLQNMKNNSMSLTSYWITVSKAMLFSS